MRAYSDPSPGLSPGPDPNPHPHPNTNPTPKPKPNPTPITLTLTLTLTRCDKGDKLFDGEKLNAGLWWWSASVVSQRNFNTYGKAGLVLAPSRTKVMCSFYSDFGTFDRGCATAGLRDSGAIVPFPPDKLRRMLKISNLNP